MTDLAQSLEKLASTPVLLVASDFDGTLAPIVDNPDDACARPEALQAIRDLASLPQTHVAVISGRSRADLAARLGNLADVHLVGSHGSEPESAPPALPSDKRELLGRVIALAEEVAARTPCARVERKPTAVAFHYRNCDPASAAASVAELMQTAPALGEVHARHGKMVLELAVTRSNKGEAVEQLRYRLGATAVLFIGDDATDEDAFATLGPGDVGVKVGPEETCAPHRVADPDQAANLLRLVARQRSLGLEALAAVPIEQHALMSDQRSAALLTPGGRITWLCMPRIDSSPVFAELVGGPAAGFFEVRPAAATGSGRMQYMGATFLVETDWGPLRVIDYMDCARGRPFQRAGRTDLIRVIEGTGRVRIVFSPRVDFGRVATRLRAVDGGLQVEGMVEPWVLYAPGIPWQIQQDAGHNTAIAEFDAGPDPVVLELRYGTASLQPSSVTEAQRRSQTDRFWSVWASTLQLPARHRELMLRSALVLRALCYGPTGAIAAAATTSLPEQAGGSRNWDYRFCWPRDASMAAGALVRLGTTGPALKLLDWIIGVQERQEYSGMISPLYTVAGGHLGTEGTIEEMQGYRASRPVRVGNAAAYQVQLDVFGPIAGLLALLAREGAALGSEHMRMIQSMVESVSQRWQDEDHGIWEVRGPRKHHVHSKVMCWQTVHTAIEVAGYLGRREESWLALEKAIAEDVLTNGWNPRRRAFCSTYGGDDIDASALSVALSGLLAPDDPRFAATVDQVERELRSGPTVYRYRFDDGLPGVEGGFHLCTAWLIEAYALLGRKDDAGELLDQFAALAGPTGLLSEEYDPHTGMALGNFPQAYSHIGLINACLAVQQAG